jgi:hypothetical protein
MVDARVGQVGALGFCAMGRANSRPRKTKRGGGGQHLPKVGSADELAEEGRRDRSAVMDVMGMGNMSAGAKQAIFWIGTVLMVAAIVALVIFTIA